MRRLIRLGFATALALSFSSGARADSFTATKFPIFLAEGFGGLDYHLVEEALEAGGAIVCDQPDDQVPHFAGSEVRAAVLIQQIESCAQENGVKRVNLIGYSQGGEDARVVLAQRPDLLASVTTVGTPHRSSSNLADRFIACAAAQQLGLPCTPGDQAAFDAFLALGAVATDPQAPNPPDPQQVLQTQCQFSSGTNLLALTVCVAAGFDIGPTFDLRYPDGLPLTSCGQGPAYVYGFGFRRIYLFSWGGGRVLTDPSDPSDAALHGTSIFLAPGSDGLVERCSTHFGKVLRDDYPWNHLDLINQRAGATGPSDPTVVFREHANRLKNLGL
jgi:triacylglycerol lipase